MNKSYRNGRDPVAGLLSGRFEQRKNRDGEVVTVFIPKVLNKYRPLDEIFHKSKSSEQEVMITEGIHPRKVSIDQKEFVKTLSEKKQLREAKAEHKKRLKKAGFTPKKRMNVSKPTFIHWRAFD